MLLLLLLRCEAAGRNCETPLATITPACAALRGAVAMTSALESE